MADAPLVAAIGARGMGKSAWVTQYLKARKPGRLLIWDLKHEHQARLVTSDVIAAMEAMKKPKFSISFRPNLRDKDRMAMEFEFLCLATMAAKNLTFLVEELAFVTKPGWAPGPWRELSLLGRHDQVEVIGTAQRPASIDKDFLGNCTLTHAARLPFKDDAQLVAQSLGVPFTELMELPALHWIERGESDTEARRGVLKFRKSSGPKPEEANSTAPG